MSPTPFIACVEDDLHVSEAIKGLLEAYGFVVEAFASAEDFLESDRLKAAACLITDVNLQGMSGLQLQDRLAAVGQSIPTVVITGFPDERVRAQALGAGAIGFLAKPIATEDLLTCVRAAMVRRPGEEM
jgi:FixJ family two-component response regulator